MNDRIYVCNDELHVLLPVGVSPFSAVKSQGRYVLFDSWPCASTGDKKQNKRVPAAFIHYVFFAWQSWRLQEEEMNISPRALMHAVE